MAMASPFAHAEPKPDKLRALGIVALNGMFDEMDAEGVLRQAVEDLLPGEIALVSSFGADSAVLLHLISIVDPTLPIYFLETGKHFAETLAHVDMLKDRLGLTQVVAVRPDPTDLARFDPEGTLWQADPDSCCHIRKTEPLEGVLAGYGGWVTGRKRFQTSERGVLPHFELTGDDRIKVNPLAYFTTDDIVAYRERHGLPEHPLYGEGYKSIGCEPCTSKVVEGEDPRAGRWRGVNKAECGIHFDFNGKIAPALGKDQRQVFKDRRFVADPWRAWREEDGEALSDLRYVHVPLSIFAANRETLMASPHPLGLAIAPGGAVETVADDLDRFSSIAIAFPSFTDGRGYSTARLLRERYGYHGEIRATGDILIDQVQFLWRCGVNALVVSNPVTAKALQEGRGASMSVFTQPVGARREVPLGTRPYLRAPDASPDATPAGD